MTSFNLLVVYKSNVRRFAVILREQCADLHGQIPGDNPQNEYAMNIVAKYLGRYRQHPAHVH